MHLLCDLYGISSAIDLNSTFCPLVDVVGCQRLSATKSAHAKLVLHLLCRIQCAKPVRVLIPALLRTVLQALHDELTCLVQHLQVAFLRTLPVTRIEITKPPSNVVPNFLHTTPETIDDRTTGIPQDATEIANGILSEVVQGCKPD